MTTIYRESDVDSAVLTGAVSRPGVGAVGL